MTIKKTSSGPALYVDDDCNFKVIRDVPVPQPYGDEVIVKVSYSGVNPADVNERGVVYGTARKSKRCVADIRHGITWKA